MARIRTVKPDFFRHEGLFEAEQETGFPIRIAFAGLWTACDRDGRFRWSPRQLKLDCLPFDDVDFSRVLDALWTRGFIERYAIDGKEFGFIPSWKDHQQINPRESESHLPEPNENNILTREPSRDDASLTRDARVPDATGGEGKGREGKGKEISTRHDASEADFDKFKSVYPSRGDASNPWKPAREKFQKLVKAGIDPNKIISGAAAYRISCERLRIHRTDKVAQAITWLNQERFNDVAAANEPCTEQIDWDRHVREYQETNGSRWPWKVAGPEPGYGGCRAPPDILAKYGFDVSRSTTAA